MALVRQQAASGVDSAFNSTVSATFGAALTNGSIILVAWEGDDPTANNSANTPTDTAGNTYVKVLAEFQSGSFELDIWYALNTHTTASNKVTITDTLGGSDGIIIIEEWTGQAASSPVDVSNFASVASGSVSPFTTANLVTTNANDLIWVACVNDDGGNYLALGSGFTNLTQNYTAFSNLGINSMVVSSTGTYTGVMTGTTNGSTIIIAVAIKAGSGVVNATIAQVHATLTVTGGTQSAAISAGPSVSITQVYASVTVTGGIQVVLISSSVSQSHASLTITGGTQTIATINDVAIAQVGATLTATCGSQGIQDVQDVQIAQVSVAVTGTGGTQVLTTVNNVSLAQVGASLTVSGGTQALLANILVPISIAQIHASVTANNGTQFVLISAGPSIIISQVHANLTASGGVQVSTLTVNVAQVYGTASVTGGNQTQYVQNNATVSQVVGSITATGGTQSVTAIVIVSKVIAQLGGILTATGGVPTISANGIVYTNIPQLHATLTVNGGTQVVSDTAVIAQVHAVLTATGGTQVETITSSIAQSHATLTLNGGTQTLIIKHSIAISQICASVKATGGLQTFFITAMPFIPKSFVYKVYRNNMFIGTWNAATEVSSDFSIREQINNAFSQVDITLARPADNYGEGFDVDYDLRVEVMVSDNDVPNGMSRFIGFISSYTPDWQSDTVGISLMGYGSLLNQIVLEDNSGTDVSINGTGNNMTLIPGDVLEHSFTAGTASSNYTVLTYCLASQTGKNDCDVTVKLYATESDCRADTNVLGYVTQTVSGVTMQNYNFVFGVPIPFTGSATYYTRIEIDPTSLFGIFMQTSTSSIYAGGTLFKFTSPSTWSDQVIDPFFIASKTTGSTTLVYNSVDPSVMLKSIIDNLALHGSNLVYTPSSIDLTGTTVSYTFNANTGLEAFNEVLTLAPENWYWYIDQTVFPHVVHFHLLSTTIDHTFVIGRDLSALSIQKSTENLVNVVYFVGTGIYTKYIDQNSIDQYGIHAIRLSDARVTQQGTADIIGNNALSPTPEFLLNVTVVDSGVQPNVAYDIESIQCSDNVKISNTGFSESSLYDSAQYDVSPYDYNTGDIGSIIFQITDMTYTGDNVVLTLSTQPPDVTKRIQDIQRNVNDVQYADTPSTPS
jgi:hypothetical protein